MVTFPATRFDALGDSHFDAALRELEQGGRLTRSVLGADGDDRARSPAATGFPSPPTGA